MAKRGASNQLTDQNWDQEEEAEEAGVFKAADDSTLKTRQIKTAKRRAPGGEGGSSGAFKGFTGFGAKVSSSPAAAPFSFGTKSLPGLGATSNGEKPLGGGLVFGSASKDPAKKESDPATKPAAEFKFTSSPAVAASSETKTTSTSGFGFTAPLSSGTDPKPLFSFGVKSPETKDAAKPPSTLSSSVAFGSSGAKSDGSPKKNGSGGNPKYLSQLKGLNESVVKWIKNHVDENPYILLTPIFKDYEKHLEKIEQENPDKSAGGEKSTTPKSADKVSSGFFFGTIKTTTEKSSDASKEESSTKTTPFTFGSGTANTSLSSGFAFKSSGPTTTAASGFSFKSDSTSGGTTTGFSFATGAPAAPAATTAAEKEGGDEDYVPPKPESVEIKEEGALYTKRCKMFFQKEGTWTERGVGNIYLKPLEDKTQLLIRADNTLGTVLLNIVLSTAIPMKRQGKNNVSLICTPNPPIDPKAEDNSKPASLLLRVKTSEDADELLEQLNKHKS